MTYIWVGLDEWVAVDKRSGHGLVTAGLSGCVGLMLMTDTRCAMSHVSSGCTLKTWRTYKPYLLNMIANLTNEGEQVRAAALAFSDEHNNELVTMLRGFLFWNCSEHPILIQDAGCVIQTVAPREVRARDPQTGRFGPVERPAEGKLCSLKTFPDAARTALKSHQARGMLSGGGRLDDKPWPHVLSDAEERD